MYLSAGLYKAIDALKNGTYIRDFSSKDPLVSFENTEAVAQGGYTIGLLDQPSNCLCALGVINATSEDALRLKPNWEWDNQTKMPMSIFCAAENLYEGQSVITNSRIVFLETKWSHRQVGLWLEKVAQGIERKQARKSEFNIGIERKQARKSEFILEPVKELQTCQNV